MLRRWWFKLRERLTGQPVLHPALFRQQQLDQQLVAGLQQRRLPRWSQLKFLPWVLTGTEKRLAWILVIIVIGVGTWLGVRVWWRASVAVPMPGGSYTEGLIGAPQYINPLLGVTNDVDRDLSRLVFCGLMRLDADGQLVPDVADKIDVAADGLTYTITLKDNVTWHDGLPVTMDDVLFTIASLQDETFGSPLSSLWSEVEVQSSDDQHLVLRLPRVFPDFKSALTVGLLPAHLWQDIPASNIKLTPLNMQPIGCGPFAFASLSRDRRGNLRSLTLRRHETYHGQHSYLDELTFKFYPDYDTAVAALKNGNMEGLASLPASAVKDVKSRRNIVLHRLSVPQYTAAFINLRNNNLLKQKEVRQALATAADRQKIVDQAMEGQAQVIDGPVIFTTSTTTAPDLTAAKQLLVLGGWKEVDGKWQKDKQTLSLKLLVADRPEHKAIADILQSSWQALGVAVEVEMVPRNELRDRIRNNSFDLVIFSESLGTTDDPFVFWHSSQISDGGLNISGWSNRQADVLLEQARATADVKARQDLLAKFQDIVKQDQPAIFLYSPIYNYPVSNVVQGITAAKIGVPADRFSGVTNWYVKTKRKL